MQHIMSASFLHTGEDHLEDRINLKYQSIHEDQRTLIISVDDVTDLVEERTL